MGLTFIERLVGLKECPEDIHAERVLYKGVDCPLCKALYETECYIRKLNQENAELFDELQVLKEPRNKAPKVRKVGVKRRSHANPYRRPRESFGGVLVGLAAGFAAGLFKGGRG